MSSTDEWSRAFARQAAVDFDAWNVLGANDELAACQKLHFLQMACEKISKAHLCAAGNDPTALQASHGYTAKTLPLIVREQVARLTGRKPKRHDFLVRHARHLAREIELLAPSINDGGRRPDNCEYPWEDSSGKIHIPAEHSFPTLHLLTAPAARTFLKCLHEAIRSTTD
jgi:hypothetical protein